MRAVEKTPWAQQRDSEHDSICLCIIASEEKRGWKCELEAPVGPGFVDVLATKISSDGQKKMAAIWEAKTLNERPSAGDIIRQLKWYRAQLQRWPNRYDAINLQVAFESENQVTNGMRSMLEREGIGIVWRDPK